MEEIKKEFDLKAELKAIGMTQKDFAEHIDKTANTINRWVLGDIEVPKIIKLYIEAYKKAKLYESVSLKLQ